MSSPRSAETRLRTTMIGSISAAEEVLGFLWGQGDPPAFLTEAEAALLGRLAGEFDRLREELRARILNLGNGQIRAMRAGAPRFGATRDTEGEG